MKDDYSTLYAKAVKALDKLADYAHYNETMEDAYGENIYAMDRATYNRVKAEQARSAIRLLNDKIKELEAFSETVYVDDEEK